MRSNLELLLLSLIQDGIGTPYELKVNANISLGSSVPALNRLSDEELVQEKAEARRGRRFSLTSKGVKALRHEWSALLNSHSADVESAVRIAYLAWRNGAIESAASHLVATADHLRGMGMIARAEAERFARHTEKGGHERLRWLRARIDEHRIDAEVNALLELARDLRKSVNGPKKKRAIKSHASSR